MRKIVKDRLGREMISCDILMKLYFSKLYGSSEETFFHLTILLYYYSRITHIVCAYFIYVKSEITLVLLGMKTFSIGGKKTIKKVKEVKT